MDKVHGVPSSGALLEFQVQVLMWAKRLTDLQLLGCELHKNAFASPLRELERSPDFLAVTSVGRKGEGKGLE